MVDLDTPAGPPGCDRAPPAGPRLGLSMHSAEVMAEPGNRRIYSNYGFEVLAETIERALGHRVRPLPGRGRLRAARHGRLAVLDGGAEAPGYGGVSTVADLAVFAA